MFLYKNLLDIVFLVLYFRNFIFQKPLSFMGLIFSFLLILILFIPKSSFSSPIYLKINLEFFPELNLIKGQLFSELNSKEEYKFVTSELLIKNIKTSSEVLSFENEGILKVFSIKGKSSLYIEFERMVNPWSLPFTAIHPPFPYPNKPFLYEINLKVPIAYENMKILIPSEEIKVSKNNEFILYTFKTQKPFFKPCIIISSAELKKLSLSYKNLNMEIYYLSELESFISQYFKKFFEDLKKRIQFLENIGGPVYPFKTLYVFIISENFPYTESFTNILFLSLPILKNPKQFLHYLAEKKLEDAIFLENEELKKGLITYLLDYKFAEDKKLFRKIKLSFPQKDTKAFFYLLFLSKTLEEKNFLDLFKDFYTYNMFKSNTWEDFLNFIKKKYPQFKKLNLSYSEFKKLDLKIKVNSFKDEKDLYQIDLTFQVSSSFKNFTNSIPINLKIKTLDEIKSFNFNLDNETQNFHITLKTKPEVLYVDPEYMLWRNLDLSEIPNCIAKILYSPGTLVVNESHFPIYRKFINYFINLGYEISFSQIDPSKIFNSSQNLIYLHTLPSDQQFSSFKNGFYLKIIPMPTNPQYSITYLYADSEKDLEIGLENLEYLSLCSEIYIEKGNLILKIIEPTNEGIPIVINSTNKNSELDH